MCGSLSIVRNGATMTRRQTSPIPGPGGQRRRRTPRPLDLVGAEPPSEERDAAAELVADLLALVDAGLLEPLAQEREIRYWPRAPGGDDAA
jgi:hypothetical protein